MKLLRNYIIVLSVIALIAAALAALSVTGYLTREDAAVLSPQDPMTAKDEEIGVEDLARLLTHAKRNATPLQETPVLPPNTQSFSLQTKTAGGVFVGAYSLHVVSMINRNALLEDLITGDYYQISIGDFTALLSHEVFEGIEEDRFFQPPLKVGTVDQIFATSMTVYAYTPEGTFRKIEKKGLETSIIVEMTPEQAAETPRITATNMPDAWSLTVRQDETGYVSQDRIKTEQLYFPAEPGIYCYELTGHWDMTTQRDWYGDLKYVLEIHITEPEAQ